MNHPGAEVTKSFGGTDPRSAGDGNASQRQRRLGGPARAGTIMEHEAVAIRGEHEGDVERGGIGALAVLITVWPHSHQCDMLLPLGIQSSEAAT
jgi:hypothetical protein